RQMFPRQTKRIRIGRIYWSGDALSGALGALALGELFRQVGRLVATTLVLLGLVGLLGALGHLLLLGAALGLLAPQLPRRVVARKRIHAKRLPEATGCESGRVPV